MAGKHKKTPGITWLDNGTFIARYTARNGRRKQRRFSELKTAEAWLIEEKYKDQQAAEEKREVFDPAELTVDKVFEGWIGKKVLKGVRNNTIIIYRGRYEHRIKEFIGDMCIRDVQPYHIDRLWESAIRKGDAVSSLNKVSFILKGIFKFARLRRLIKDNPMEELELDMPKREKKNIQVLDRAEQNLFMKEAEKSVHYLAFVLMLNTGIRYGELSGLRWSDIDWKAKKLTVNRTVFYNQKEKIFETNPPKTENGRRTIPLNPIAYDVLVKKKNEEHKCIPITEFTRSGTIFVNDMGLPTLDAVYNRSLTAIQNRMKLKKHLTCHVLRHSFASRCIESGIKPKTVQMWLGHSDINLTMNLYVHVTEEESECEMQKFILCS